MSDWEIWADNQADLIALCKTYHLFRLADLSIPGDQGGIQADGFTPNGTRFCIDYYKNKMVPTGATTIGPFGNVVPVMVALPGVYATMRWLPPNGTTPPPTPPVGSNVTISPLPANSPVVFFGA